MKRCEKLRMLPVCALAAAVLLLLFSRCSPLYPTNNWGEANAFFTVGRGMLEGKLPYRDLVLGAGPLVYALHALAALISPDGFLGVWLIEIVSMTALMYFAWKAAVHISGMPVLSMGAVSLLALMLVSSRAFIYGDTVEEFVLPLQMFALCDLLAYLDTPERSISPHRLVLHGFLAGCVFWMKYVLAGVHLAFIVVIAVDEMVRQRELKGAVCMCLEFAAGMVFATAPWFACFGANGALMTFLRAYLGGEWKQIVQGMAPVRDAFAGLLSGTINNPACALAVLCGAGFLLYRLVHRRWNVKCTAVVAAFACTVLMIYFKDDRYRFSPLGIGSFMMLCAGPLALLVRYAWQQRRVYAALVCCGAAACGLYNCLTNENLPFIGYPREKLPQVIFAEHIEENGGGTLFTRNIADRGFYLALDQIPEFRAFAYSVPYYNSAMHNEVYSYVDGRDPDWIVVSGSYIPAGYVAVETAESEYDTATNAGRRMHSYSLCRRMEWSK